MKWQSLERSHLLKKTNNKTTNNKTALSRIWRHDRGMHRRERFTLPTMRRAPPVSLVHGAFRQWGPQHPGSLHKSRQRQVTCLREKPGHGPSPTSAGRYAGQFQAFLCLWTMGNCSSGWGCWDKGKWTWLTPVTNRTLLSRRDHSTCQSLRGQSCLLVPQFLERRAHLRGAPEFVPNTRLSPQVNQDYNHNSKDRIVLFFPFFLKGVRAWKIQHTNETKCQKKKKYKKIENRKMYLQVVH